MKRTREHRKAGYSIIELMIATTLFVVVMVSSLALMERDAHLSRSTLAITAIEDQSTQMLYRIERELADALVSTPRAVLRTPLNAGETGRLEIDDHLMFPPVGQLVVSRGTNDREVIAYTGLDTTPGDLAFTGLTRGQACTTDVTHAVTPTNDVYWVGLAEPIVNQTNPPPSSFDGIASEEGVGVLFVGSGIGISYRVPVDPAGGTNFIAGEDVQWGATVGGNQITTGWAAIVYVPTGTINEATTGDDLNEDGDALDVFDVGQLRRFLWDTANPVAVVDDLGLGPRTILQEQCNWGGDLDGDSFDDPMFLWDEDTRQLHVRLFLVGTSVRDLPIVRRVESVMFLRNENAL
jgi:hypothetical protein